MFNLSFSISTPNNELDQDMIVLSYFISLSCAPDDLLFNRAHISK